MNKNTLMVIDDDNDVLNLICRYFENKGYHVHAFNDASTALSKLISRQVYCNVIISDLMMPKLTGIEFVNRIRTAGLNIPIILVTANKKVEVAVSAVKAGAYDFLVKPVHFPQLLISVERALYMNDILFENQNLKSQIKLERGNIGLEGITGNSKSIKLIIDLVRRISDSSAHTLIKGEKGTGKRLIAETIHKLSKGSTSFIKIDCNELNSVLIADNLRYEFLKENEYTLYFENIDKLDKNLQKQLIEFLESVENKPNSSLQKIKVRVIASSEINLQKLVETRKFSEELYYKLNVISLSLPPLRERVEDIQPLIEFFNRKYSLFYGKPLINISENIIERFTRYNWPENIDSLENILKKTIALQDVSIIEKELDEKASAITDSENFQIGFLNGICQSSGRLMTLDELISQYVLQVMRKNNGVKEKTARDLKIDRKTLYRRLKDIERISNIKF